jgi:predicted Rossmann fold flavoprotein
MTGHDADVVIVGAGASGLMAAIWAGRTNPHRIIFVLDGTHRPGKKILVSGGGRCNVTHDQVDERAYAGSSRHAIKKVLRRFGVPQTVSFFREIGVELEREDTGKLFPTTGNAHTILDALHQAVRETGVRPDYSCRVEAVERHKDIFLVSGEWGRLEANSLILATGGRSLPESGSDGHGHQIAQSLGHTLSRTFPALVPLTLPRNHFICALSGLSLPVTLELRTGSGKRLQAFTGSMLCAHFGISGPVALDMSRYYIAACHEDPTIELAVNWLPEETPETLEHDLLDLGRKSVGVYLRSLVPGRLAEALCSEAGVVSAAPGDQLARDARKNLVQIVTALPLPITGNRGFAYAEVTAGGVPLSELCLETMESRVCPGLHLCGEICDVDGRIGGYNFQWAWASGYVAGSYVGR